jgi:hypothetical protein
MPVLTMEFSGICTHLQQTYHRDLPHAYRVLLVNAERRRHMRHHEIPPHHPTIALHHAGIRYPLKGVTFEVSAAGVRTPLDVTALRHVPNLTELMWESGQAMPPASADVVSGKIPERTAAYFDFDAGVLAAGRTRGGAIATIFRIEADEITITATPFKELGPVPDPFRKPLRIEDELRICVANLDAEGQVKHDYDFFLHYLLAKTLPDEPQLPRRREVPPIELECGTNAIGSGCSNSTYP